MLVPGFLIWNIWKECNRWIFKDKASEPQHIIDQILKHLKETIKTLFTSVPKDPPLPQEENIILNLGLQPISPQGIINGVRTMNTGASSWKPPAHGFFKVNIDGASKGNPRVVGFGGAIRDHQGKTKYIFHGHLGKDANNMVELLALEKYLEILVEANLQNVIIEADSKLIIRVAKNIHNGISLDKVSSIGSYCKIFIASTLTYKPLKR